MVAKSLIDRGLSIVAKNINTKFGEIDLIASTSQEVIFIEVKTRTSDSYGFPEEAVNYHKRLHFTRAALSLLPKYAKSKSWALLVVAVELDLIRRAARLRSIELDA